jgi:hypothetical protein
MCIGCAAFFKDFATLLLDDPRIVRDADEDKSG